MAILTFIKFPTDSIITKEQLEGVSSINENKLMEIFKRTFVSGVMADGITSDVFKPTYISNVGTVVNFSISPGVGIIGSGYMVILESTLETSTDFSVNGNKTLFIKFNQDWSDDITTIQKPTGNIIEVSKVQLQDSNILEWSDYDPTSFDPDVPGNNFPIGKLIYEDSAYKFKYDEGYRHIYIPNTRFPDKSYNISPSVDTFCSLFELLSCRGGKGRQIYNPFGMTSNDLGNLLEIIKAFIRTSGVVNKAGCHFIVSGAGTTTLTVASGKAIVRSGKYVSNDSSWSTSELGSVIGTFHVYIHAYRDSDGYDTHEIVMTQTDYSGNEDYLILADIVLFYDIDHMEISSVSDLREQLQLKSATTTETYNSPADIPSLYITKETEVKYVEQENRYDVNVMWGDQFDGYWKDKDTFVATSSPGWADDQWDASSVSDKEGWYLYDPDSGLYFSITHGETTALGYELEIIGDAGYGAYPQNVNNAKIVSKLDWVFVQYKKHADEDWKNILQFFPSGYSELEIICPFIESNVNYDYRIEGWLNGMFSYSDVKQNISLPAFVAFKAAHCKVIKPYAGQNIGHDATTLYKFNATEYDTHNCFNTTTHTFTVPQSGKYLIIFQVFWENDEPQIYATLSVKKGGTTDLVKISQTIDYNTFVPDCPAHQTLQTIISLAEGDEIAFYVKQINNAGTSVYINYRDTFAVISRLIEY